MIDVQGHERGRVILRGQMTVTEIEQDARIEPAAERDYPPRGTRVLLPQALKGIGGAHGPQRLPKDISLRNRVSRSSSMGRLQSRSN